MIISEFHFKRNRIPTSRTFDFCISFSVDFASPAKYSIVFIAEFCQLLTKWRRGNHRRIALCCAIHAMLKREEDQQLTREVMAAGEIISENCTLASATQLHGNVYSMTSTPALWKWSVRQRKMQSKCRAARKIQLKKIRKKNIFFWSISRVF